MLCPICFSLEGKTEPCSASKAPVSRGPSQARESHHQPQLGSSSPPAMSFARLPTVGQDKSVSPCSVSTKGCELLLGRCHLHLGHDCANRHSSDLLKMLTMYSSLSQCDSARCQCCLLSPKSLMRASAFPMPIPPFSSSSHLDPIEK